MTEYFRLIYEKIRPVDKLFYSEEKHLETPSKLLTL
jgi:hypothetical protein